MKIIPLYSKRRSIWKLPHMNVCVSLGGEAKQYADRGLEAVGLMEDYAEVPGGDRCRSMGVSDSMMGDLRAVLGEDHRAPALTRRSSCGWHVLCLLHIPALTPTSF